MNFGLHLKDALMVGAIGGILFIPIVGLVLDGQSLLFHLPRAVAVVVIVFFGRLGISLLRERGLGPRWAGVISPFNTRLQGFSQAVFQGISKNQIRVLMALVGALVILPFLPSSSNYLIQIITLTFVYVILGMGLNIVVGLAGLLDLGYVAFYAVGAYGYALMAQHLGISFWFAIPAAAALAALAGCVLGFPVLRMHGDYLAIVTLGFGEIVRILLINLTDITGGPNGISVPRPTLFGLEFSKKAGANSFHEFFGLDYSASYRYIFIYLVVLVFTILALWVFHRLREMPIGRAWEALREDEVACKALGINPVTTKLSAFTLGAAFGGVGGVFFAAMEGFINPSSFHFIESAIIVSIVVLGGMGSILGVTLAAVGLTLLPELFRGFESYRMLIFGMAMVIVMIWRPGGLLKVNRKSFKNNPFRGGAS